MTKQELIDYCLSLNEVIETYPFDDKNTVMKHNDNKKMFAIIFTKDNIDFISLKCEPLKAEVLRQTYEGVTGGYHLNKKHWNTININLDVDKNEIIDMINDSYNLIKPKRKQKKTE